MSWFFGIAISQDKQLDRSSFHIPHPEPLIVISTSCLYLAFGGIPETCVVVQETESSGWAIVGLGIKTTDDKATLMKKEDWLLIIAAEQFPYKILDGHFIVLRWKNDQIEMFSDQLGLRTAYAATFQDHVCFSTRLDWVAQTSRKNELELEAVAGRWLLFNQLSYNSCVKGIERIGPSGQLVISKGAIISNTCCDWLPEFSSRPLNVMMDELRKIIQGATESDWKVAMALSGGLDSRVIFSMLFNDPRKCFSTFSFGEKNDPDSQISSRIAIDQNISHQHFLKPIPKSHELLEMIREYAAENILVEPISTLLRLQHYKDLYHQGNIIVDGGFGEIARRQYLNRLATFGKEAILQKNSTRALEYLRVSRADIFQPEVTQIFEEEASVSLDRKFSEMPEAVNIGIENFINLLSIRSRFPNFGEAEQARSDVAVVNFMPMAQPSFLSAVFSTDLSLRKNGRLFRDFIKKEVPQLSKYELVKGGTTYPFYLSHKMSYGFVKLKKKLRQTYIDSTSERVLECLKNIILDLAQESKSFSLYAHKKIDFAVKSYYSGDKRQQRVVEWWLTFDLWRRSLLPR